jgi:hypothetical protein
MKKGTKKTELAPLLGEAAQDRRRVRECLTELGWPQARLAKEANLSLIMVRSFLNGTRNLSLAAGRRVLSAIGKGYEEKRVIEEALQVAASDLEKKAPSPEDAARMYPNILAFMNLKHSAMSSASEDLAVAHKRIEELENELSEEEKRYLELAKTYFTQRDKITRLEERVEQLQKQLRDAGLEPTDLELTDY